MKGKEAAKDPITFDDCVITMSEVGCAMLYPWWNKQEDMGSRQRHMMCNAEVLWSAMKGERTRKVQVTIFSLCILNQFLLTILYFPPLAHTKRLTSAAWVCGDTTGTATTNSTAECSELPGGNL